MNSYTSLYMYIGLILTEDSPGSNYQILEFKLTRSTA